MSLRLEHVSYIYEPGTPMEKKALEDVSLRVEKGEILAVIGATGSGKSTLIQLMNGLNKPSEGKVYFNDTDIFSENYSRKALRSKVGLVFQYPEYQLFETDVLKDICFGPKNLGLPEEECLARARKAMREVGLDEDYEKESPFDLSGGEKRRVAIAGVLAMEPEILILDEPAAGLDPEGKREILKKLNILRDEQGIGIVLVSHSMEDVAQLADRVIVLEKGRILTQGTAREVFARREMLHTTGLSLPVMSRLWEKLQEKGFPVSGQALSVNEAKDKILKVLREKGHV